MLGSDIEHFAVTRPELHADGRAVDKDLAPAAVELPPVFGALHPHAQ